MRLILSVIFALTFCMTGAAHADPVSGPPSGVTEQPVTLGEGEWAVSAVLTLPAGASADRPVPGVVLEHGFGPGTLDADVGPNKIFRETAWALAGNGIAVLRHAKRSTQHAAKFRSAGRHQTIAEEWLDDAASGVALLKNHPAIQSDRVYVVGHSASAGLAPSIALRTGARGAVLVSGSPRSAPDLIREQMAYVGSLAPSGPQQEAETQTMLAEVALLEDPSLDPDVQALGHPLWYWRELDAQNPVDDVRLLRARGGRVSIIQGGRDYLVGERDWALWNELFADDRGVARHLYTSLNHMMQPGEGKMTPAEYGQANVVSGDFTGALAQWLKMDD